MSGLSPVYASVPEFLSPALRSPRQTAAIAAITLAAAGAAWYFLRSRRPTEEELERARRQRLAEIGRITDGTITETADGQIHHLAETENSRAMPQMIVYNYRIAGVSYEAAQDVTTLADLVRDIRTDLPVQVRYEPHNPANSIVVAERWSGLRLSADAPRPVLGIDRHLEDRQMEDHTARD